MSVFKRRWFPAEIVLLCVRWYCCYGISYRDLEEMMDERGVAVDHVTLYRWVQRYAPEIEKRVRWYQGYRSSSWRVDETYVRVGGKWIPVPRRRQARTSDRLHAVRPPQHQGSTPLSGQGAEGHAHLAAGVDHHRQARFLSEGTASAETRGRAGKTRSSTGRRSTSTTGSRPIMVRSN